MLGLPSINKHWSRAKILPLFIVELFGIVSLPLLVKLLLLLFFSSVTFFFTHIRTNTHTHIIHASHWHRTYMNIYGKSMNKLMLIQQEKIKRKIEQKRRRTIAYVSHTHTSQTLKYIYTIYI